MEEKNNNKYNAEMTINEYLSLKKMIMVGGSK
jgi:hypothetical protein